jgi:hypothetical protein
MPYLLPRLAWRFLGLILPGLTQSVEVFVAGQWRREALEILLVMTLAATLAVPFGVIVLWRLLAGPAGEDSP